MRPSPRQVARSATGAAAIAVLAILAACSAAPRAPQPQPPSGPGYRLTEWAPSSSFVVRVHPSAGSLTDEVMAAAAEVTARSGITFTLGPPAPTPAPDLVRSTPEITVVVGTYCSAGAIGCAEMWGQWGFTPEERHVIRDVRLSVVPAMLDDAATRRAVLLHELGHAVGLDHHSETFEGQHQVMNPYVEPTMSQYRSGDDAGLAATGTRARPATDPAAALLQLCGATPPAARRLP